MTSTRDARPDAELLHGTSARKWARLGLWLVAVTMAYNVIEAVIALWSGTRAGSVALLGFGFDSVIECAAAGVLIWRLNVEAAGADHERVESSERLVRRFVGATFILLAAYVIAEACWTLIRRDAPDESQIGIVLACASVVIMPLLSWAKIVAAKRIGSRALLAEAKETLACSYLSLTLLLGLGANAAVSWWWADPAAALLMVPWLLKEGIEGLRGEKCDED